jgi:AAA15 family ATPase/GTPase
VVPDDDALRIEFELSGGERLPARLISDGMLRVLALPTALRLDPRPYLIGIEEPENGIYPPRLRALVELLQQEAERRPPEQPGWVDAVLANLPPQILLTTHSPIVLATLRRHPQCLRFVDVVHRDHRRVTRARAVGDPSEAGRHLVVSMREIDQILDNLTGEDAE